MMKKILHRKGKYALHYPWSELQKRSLSKSLHKPCFDDNIGPYDVRLASIMILHSISPPLKALIKIYAKIGPWFSHFSFGMLMLREKFRIIMWRFLSFEEIQGKKSFILKITKLL